MSSERVRVQVSDGGLDAPVDLGADVRIVRFIMPNGDVLEVEAFARHGTNMVQIRTGGGMQGVPYMVPRAGNVVAVGVMRDA